ncbi:uncharacterized protein LOC103317379 [Nasonia vitripennis]|uniref:MADF domain-containing protein n=1 Tax=Nasonia vitripennis TaxID=7425 RepID=A0A7M7ITN8_NASVI|nr:uncharacterized protein LOC103317379 [Nasonia vitripennis]
MTWDVKDEERLITAVLERPALWDKTHSQCSNNYYLAKMWDEINQAFNMESKDKVRNKWRSIVTTLKKEENKLKSLRSGACANDLIKSTWHHFKAMQFIHGPTTRESTGNITHYNSLKDNQQPSTSKLGDPTEQHQRSDESQSPFARYPTAIVPIASTEAIPVATTIDDADCYYFSSLMPHISKIKDKKSKMRFRMDAMYLLLKFLEEEEKKPSIKQELNENIDYSDDDDIQVVDFYFTKPPNKKVKVEPALIEKHPKKEPDVEYSEEFKEYIVNHMAKIKRNQQKEPEQEEEQKTNRNFYLFCLNSLVLQISQFGTRKLACLLLLIVEANL